MQVESSIVGYWTIASGVEGLREVFHVAPSGRYVHLVRNPEPAPKREWLPLLLWIEREAGDTYLVRASKRSQPWRVRMCLEEGGGLMIENGGSQFRSERLPAEAVPDWFAAALEQYHRRMAAWEQEWASENGG